MLKRALSEMIWWGLVNGGGHTSARGRLTKRSVVGWPSVQKCGDGQQSADRGTHRKHLCWHRESSGSSQYSSGTSGGQCGDCQ
jgi:hypothetical protein